MYSFLIVIHVLVCIFLTIIILLQSSKGGGLAGVFGGGGGGMNAVFGGRGAGSFLSKLTTILAIIFMTLSLFLGLITKGKQQQSGVVSQERAKGTVTSPADVLPTVPTEGEPAVQPVAPAVPEESKASEDNE